jgi:hypothetical protein
MGPAQKSKRCGLDEAFYGAGQFRHFGGS